MKALALVSGGLDSALALYLLKAQKIEIEAINFYSFAFDHRETAEKICKQFNIPLRKVNISEELLTIVQCPKFGYGAGLNPCLDCHILMVKKASEIMKEINALFLVTGEVIGQRPKSQYFHHLEIIEKESGLVGKILRPLSALRLPSTIAEEQGIVDRAKLLGLTGRSRRTQLYLAKEIGLTDYLTPAGGCLLTDETFSRRLKDLLNHKINNLKDVELLKIGRHFRLNENAKLIIGRNKVENVQIVQQADPTDLLFEVKNIGSPVSLLRGKSDQQIIYLAAVLTAKYSDAKNFSKVTVCYWVPQKADSMLQHIIVYPESLKENEISKLRI